jgi:hypothetical protein
MQKRIRPASDRLEAVEAGAMHAPESLLRRLQVAAKGRKRHGYAAKGVALRPSQVEDCRMLRARLTRNRFAHCVGDWSKSISNFALKLET